LFTALSIDVLMLDMYNGWWCENDADHKKLVIWVGISRNRVEYMLSGTYIHVPASAQVQLSFTTVNPQSSTCCGHLTASTCTPAPESDLTDSTTTPTPNIDKQQHFKNMWSKSFFSLITFMHSGASAAISDGINKPTVNNRASFVSSE
jgi:hypothetical protein